MHANAYEDNPDRRNDTSTIIDAACFDRAKKRNMKIGELDDIEGMNKLLEETENKSDDISTQVDSLMIFLKNFEKRKQDIINQAQNQIPTLIKMRNDKWLPKMLGAMNEASTMFVFGGGHLMSGKGRF